MNHNPIPSATSQQGAVLLEALIAILIFSLGVLALAGLQSAMIKNTDTSKFRTEASFIAQDAIGEIWTNVNNAPVDTNGKISLSNYAGTTTISRLPDGTRTVSVDSNRVVTVTVSWIAPGEASRHSYSTTAMIEGL